MTVQGIDLIKGVWGYFLVVKIAFREFPPVNFFFSVCNFPSLFSSPLFFSFYRTFFWFKKDTLGILIRYLYIIHLYYIYYRFCFYMLLSLFCKICIFTCGMGTSLCTYIILCPATCLNFVYNGYMIKKNTYNSTNRVTKHLVLFHF